MLAAVIIGSLITVFILIISIPVDIKIDWNSRQKPQGRFVVGWLFGIVGKRITGQKPRPKDKKRLSLTERLHRIQHFLEIIWTRGLLKQILHLIRDIFRQLYLKYCNVDIKIGLGDPSETGLLFVIVYSIMPFSSRLTHHVNLQPEFNGEAIFEGQLHIIIRFLPIKLIVPITKFVFSVAALNLTRALISNRWKRTKYMPSYQL